MLIGPASNLPPVSAGNARKLVAVNAASDGYDLIRRFGSRVVLVAPADGDYPTLTAAMAAITTASASEPWLIIVSGAIPETAVVTAKSHISVLFLPGACLTMTSTGTANAVGMSSLTNTKWVGLGQGPHIIRAGVVASGNAVVPLNVTGGDATVQLEGLHLSNQITHSGSPSICCGLIIQSSAQAEVRNMRATAASVGTSAHGIYVSTASPTLYHCTGRGGDIGSSNGIYMTGAGTTRIIGGEYTGGSGGTFSMGLQADTTHVVEAYEGAHFVGGAGQYTSSHGLRLFGGAVMWMEDCHARAGDNNGSCSGINLLHAAQLRMHGGSARGGKGGTGCHGVTLGTSAVFIARNATLLGGGVDRRVRGSYSYSNGGAASFVLDVNVPMRLVGAYVTITGETSGATVQLADTAGGANMLTPAISLTSPTTLYVPVTAAYVLAANASIYVLVTGGDASTAFDVQWIAEPSFGGTTTNSCLGLHLDTDGYVDIQGGVIAGNSDSLGCYVTANGMTRSKFANVAISTGPRDVGTRRKAIQAASSWNPAPLYQCTLDGGQTNITAPAGTANGTNVEF